MNTLEIKKRGIKMLFVGLMLVLSVVLIGCSESTQSGQNTQTTPSSVSVLTPIHTVEAIVESTATYESIATLNPTATPKPPATPKPTATLSTPKPSATLKPTSPVVPTLTIPTKVVDTGSKSRGEFGEGGLAKDLESWADIKLPQFIAASHIKISDIAHVSKFRSSAGHDFSDSFEVCCSMKHYFIPIDQYGTRFTQPIYSPVDGVVLYLSEPSGGHSDDWKISYEEQTGKKTPVDYRDWNIYIRPDSAPNVWITHMHVNPLDEIIKKVPPTDGQSMMMGRSKAATEGYRVKAGDLIAHGLGEIIVKRHLEGNGIPSGCNSADARNKSLQSRVPGCKDKVQLHSIFEFMTDDVFDEYREITDVTKADFLITKEERTKNPLVCDGEFFANSGNTDDPETYVKLQGTSSSSDTPSSEAQEQGSLPGFHALAAGRGMIASFEASGTHVLAKFTTDQAYVLVIAATGGPINVLVEDGSGKRGIFSRPSGNGITTYETAKFDPGQIEVSVETDKGINWQIIAVEGT